METFFQKHITIHAYLVMYATLSHLGHKCGMVFAFLQGLFLGNNIHNRSTDLIVVQRKSRKKIDQVGTWQAKQYGMHAAVSEINDA